MEDNDKNVKDDVYSQYGLIKPDNRNLYPNSTKLQQITNERKRQMALEQKNKAHKKVLDIVHLYNIDDILKKTIERANNGFTDVSIPFPVQPPSDYGDPALIALLFSGSYEGKFLRSIYDVEPGISYIKYYLGIENIVFDYETFEIVISW